MKNVTVLYFGGDKIILTIAAAGVNGTHVVVGRGIREYSGIVDGEFVNPEELAALVKECTEDAFKKNNVKIDKLFVGVPPCFSSFSVTQSEREFLKRQKITEKEIKELTSGEIDGITFAEPHSIISRKAVYYKLDEGRAVIDAIGYTAQKLHAQISVVSVADRFIELVGTSLARGRFKRVEFIPAVLAEAIGLINEDIRDQTCLLISSGMFTTSVAAVTGDSLVAFETFDMGLAHVVNDVSIVKKVGYSKAKELTCNPDDKVRDVIMARLEVMAEQIFSIINRMDKKLFHKPVFICGGNIDALDGVREYFEKALDVKITQCVCPLTEQNFADEITNDALINLALKY